MGSLEGVKKVTTVGEIDELIPLIKRVHMFAGISKYISLTGYLTWLVSNLPSPNFAIWYGTDSDLKPTWFVVVQVQVRNLKLECSIADAYMDGVDTEFSEEMFEYIEAWAKDHSCELLSCYSNRPEALARKYNFDKFGTVMIKAI